MPKVIVPLADGVEEIEAVIVIDTLRRADFEVSAVGITPSPITASRQVKLLPDTSWHDIQTGHYDAIVLPGGATGAENLAAHDGLLTALREFNDTGKLVAAICAAPAVLETAGVLGHRRATSYPTFADKLGDVDYREERVVTDGNCITSRGPGTAFDFALAIICYFEGEEAARKIAEPMLLS